MDRVEALARLQVLVGCDLVSLGTASGITIWKGDRLNKGWAGHTIERHLGLALNSSRAPNFGSWELKVVPVKAIPNGRFRVKETMAITMIDPVEVAAKEFPDSHLFLKLQRMIVVARVFESAAETHSPCHLVTEFDLSDQDLCQQIKAELRSRARRDSYKRLQLLERIDGSAGSAQNERTRARQHLARVLREGAASRQDYRARLVHGLR